MKRYFIVFYEGEYSDQRCMGNLSFSCDGFLNLHETTQAIIDETGVDDCTITNIIELDNYIDYERWNYDDSISL